MSAKFRFELSDFFLVHTKMGGKALRCTRTWILEDGQLKLGESIEGCLFSRNKAGVLRFQLPVNRIGHIWKQFGTITPDYNKLVCRRLEEEAPRLIELLGEEFVGIVNPGKPKFLAAKSMGEVDPDFPATIGLDFDNVIQEGVEANGVEKA